MTGIRIAARQLARNPAFSAIVALTLALGIGASTLIYSVIDGVLLKPLPYPEPDRIVRVFQIGADGSNRTNLSDPNFADVKEQTRSFSALAQFATITEPVLAGTEAARLDVAYVSREFLDVVHVGPALGRAFVPEEQRLGAPPSVLISHRYWERYLGGVADFASRSMRVGKDLASIVGVMPPEFDFPDGADVWIPRELDAPGSRTAHNYRAVGRLAPGVSLEQAREDATTVARRLKQQYGDETWMVDAALVPLQDFIVGNTKPALLVLGAAVLLLFLVACTNVVSMLLARAVAREREIGVRVALGAGPWRLARQFLGESLLLCGVGCALGVGLAWWGLELLAALHAGTLPRADSIRIDWSTLAFAAALAAAVAVSLSALLARHATRGGGALVATHWTAGDRRSWARGVLVAAQTAMAVVLLIGAVLLARSFVQLSAVEPGFSTDDVLLMNIAFPIPSDGADAAPIGRFHEDLIERVRGLPGVTAVGGVTAPPLAGGAGNGVFVELRRPDEVKALTDFVTLAKDPTRSGFGEFRVASEDYFAAFGIPLLRGRVFERGDGPSAEHVAVVSRSFAERKWPGEDALGKLVEFGNMDGDLTPFRIVGIVGDVREYGLDAEPRPTFYGYYRQRTRAIAWSFWIAIKAPHAERLAPAAREIVRELNPEIVPGEVRMAADLTSKWLAPRRFNLVLLGVFGATALLLALAGIYGAVAFNVAQRTREIGVRVALGARTASVVGMVVRRSLAWVATGLVAGLFIALGASRVLGSLLYGVSAHDPGAYAAAAGALLTAAVVAAWLPARRAARVDPMTVLRSD